MKFVAADSCRTQLERLTQLLFSAFPGSTVYQHTDLLRVPHDVLSHKIDAVLLEAEMEEKDGLDLAQKLRRQKPDVPVFLVSRTNELCEQAAAAGASGYFLLPDGEERLLEAIRLTRNGGSAS